MTVPGVKSLLLAAALFAGVACGESSSPEATQPTATPIVETPSPPATQSPAPAQTVVAFVTAPITVARGHNATLQVKTAAKVSCTIQVDYASGPATAAGLVAKTSDGAGNVSWTWKVGTNTTRGSWPIIVTCGTGSAQTHITVT